MLQRLLISAPGFPAVPSEGWSVDSSSGAQHRARTGENPRTRMISLPAILRFSEGAFAHARGRCSICVCGLRIHAGVSEGIQDDEILGRDTIRS